MSVLPAMLAAVLVPVMATCREPPGDNLVGAAPSVVAAVPARAAVTEQQEAPMTRVVIASASVVLRAAHIVVVTVGTVSEGEELRLEVTMRDVLKGKPITATGTPVSVISQRASPGRSELQPQGPWAAAGPTPGARLVVFSSATSTDAAAVLAEPAILRVLTAAASEDDTRRALAIERAGGPLPARITSVSEPPPLSALFGEYVLARLGEATLYADAAGFSRVMTWLEDSKRSPELQMYMAGALSGKLLVEAAPSPFIERLALASLRILATTGDETLATQLLETYLPNLLGLEGASPSRTVQAVLAGDLGTKTRALAALRRRPASNARDRLLDWLAG